MSGGEKCSSLCASTKLVVGYAVSPYRLFFGFCYPVIFFQVQVPTEWYSYLYTSGTENNSVYIEWAQRAHYEQWGKSPVQAATALRKWQVVKVEISYAPFECIFRETP